MPISEDEFDFRPVQDAQMNMSKAELRKTHKPIMEKRRRARINHCLNEIKSLILEAMNKDPARHSKLEKADILEMAVKHLQNMQRQQLALAMATDPSVLRKFKSGFNECAVEIDRYVNQLEGVDEALKERIKAHLQKCIGGIEQVAHFSFPGFAGLPFVSTSAVFGGASQGAVEPPPPLPAGGDPNNNARIPIPQGIQLIPSRLPSGELALLVPNSSNLPYFSSLAAQHRPSAFAAVIPATETRPATSPSASPRADRLSPQGFRPVQPSKPFHAEEPQVAHVSSTQNCEVKTIRFPMIHNSLERKLASPRKIVEPLCIITNQNERYKQAQVRGDSADFEENKQQGVKRNFGEGLLTVAAQDYPLYPSSKVLKIEPQNSDNGGVSDLRNDGPAASVSRDNNEPSSDMWRPW